MSIVVDVKVIPSSGRQKCILDKSGQIKCYLKSQPEKGKANAELVDFIASSLKVPKELVTMQFGATSPRKRIKINLQISLDDFMKAIGIEKQLSI
ncbi:TPA: hypothetical protein DEO28_04600 [Candidatus Dependentiae bacterium]|nr:MAG: hypothetical protein UR14_C0002G0038 [candidate division TM6 bacterium GW2011_GWE2_31_21]KKP53835.1 MAG: hypothetical protein UR43_C0002G0038 [candidate division TM6 bacterium GW2011_GWF2_33_332]HBS47615.1 hypothetical protein [Candidatus Dependentiae bacterium]HBZ73764.1 hypothetical protein [Candidatus Dependentiae bacterium]